MDFKSEKEVRDFIRNSGEDYSDFADGNWYLLPIGTELRGRRVSGEKIAHYAVAPAPMGAAFTIRYVTEEGNDCGALAENDRYH